MDRLKCAIGKNIPWGCKKIQKMILSIKKNIQFKITWKKSYLVNLHFKNK